MSVASSTMRELRASYAFVERNMNLSKRYWGWELVFVCYSIAGALSVLYIGRAANEFGAGSTLDTNRLILYLTVGALVWSYLSAVFDSISETISYERWEGTIEYTMMAPVLRVTHLLGASVFSVIYGLIRTGVILGRHRAAIWREYQSRRRGLDRCGYRAQQLQFHGPGHHGGHPAPALHRARRPDDQHHLGFSSAGLGCVLSDQRAAGMDAVARPRLARVVCP